MKKLIIVLLLLIYITGCDESPSISDDFRNDPYTNVMLIVNEGLYGQNNSTLTLYSTSKDEVTQQIYYTQNEGKRLGDTANDAEIFGNKAYIAVTQSNKIEVIGLDDYKTLGYIDFGEDSAPREITIVSETEAYVTCLGKNELCKFNPTSMEVIASVGVGQQPEGVAVSNGHIFVANSGYSADSTVYVINQSNFTVTDTIVITKNPRFVLKDLSGDIIVVASGVYDGVGEGGVYKISSTNLEITDFIKIDKNPGECAVDGEYLYVANSDGLHKIDITNFSGYDGNNIIASSFDVNPTNGVIYSVHYYAVNNTLFVGNAKDFTQNGEVVEISLTGEELNRFECGLNPGTIVSVN